MRSSPRHDEDLIRQGVAIHARAVSAAIGGAQTLVDVDFSARAGEAALIFGPTGAGKTSLTRLFALSLAPASGRLAVLGVDAARLPPQRRARLKRRIGLVEEQPRLMDDHSVFDNAALPLRLAGARLKDYRDDVEELLTFVGCGPLAGEPARALSAGERRQVALARALASKPDLLIADEPTSGVSPEAGARIVRVLAEMRRIGAAVVITSQDETLLHGVPARRWRIERGRLSMADDAGYDP